MEENQNLKVSLEQYRILVTYLQYENTIYWTRSGVALVIQSALLGFLTQVLPVDKEEFSNLYGVCISFLFCFFGLVITYFWWRIDKMGLFWIDRWQTLLLDLEPSVYGKIEVFRGAVSDDDGYQSAYSQRITVSKFIYVFYIVWFAALAFLCWAGTQNPIISALLVKALARVDYVLS